MSVAFSTENERFHEVSYACFCREEAQVQRAAFKVWCKKNVVMNKCKISRSMPTRSENCISALAEIVVAFFGAGASAAAFFAPFFAMLIDRVFGSQGTYKVKALNPSWTRRMRASM